MPAMPEPQPMTHDDFELIRSAIYRYTDSVVHYATTVRRSGAAGLSEDLVAAQMGRDDAWAVVYAMLSRHVVAGA